MNEQKKNNENNLGLLVIMFAIFIGAIIYFNRSFLIPLDKDVLSPKQALPVQPSIQDERQKKDMPATLTPLSGQVEMMKVQRENPINQEKVDMQDKEIIRQPPLESEILIQ